MSGLAIKVDHLSKEYRLGEAQQSYGTIKDALASMAKRGLQNLASRGKASKARTRFRAISDVSFEVAHGEVVGVIGPNGAGKSTLLKLLSRITRPTTGRIETRGRLASLLEVGTGFHGELSGRENVFLNGAILGMTRREIRKRFDEIVAFAEVERFIDTPVKRYSSGMYLRLAFAVAAHLEPEILVVDEILAVGDAAFQRKCLGKMDSAAREGRTILFVSHNMGAVSHLCTTGLVLSKGRVAMRGSITEAVDFYNHEVLASPGSGRGDDPHVLFQDPDDTPESDFAVTRVEILDTNGRPKPIVSTWDDVVFRISYSSKRYVGRGSVVLELSSFDGAPLLVLSTEPDGTLPMELHPGTGSAECVLRKLPLAAGEYIVGAALAVPNTEYLWRAQHLCGFSVTPADVYGSGLAPNASRCFLAVDHEWRLP